MHNNVIAEVREDIGIVAPDGREDDDPIRSNAEAQGFALL